jgi:predicted alpha/beta hydrolase family esterase
MRRVQQDDWDTPLYADWALRLSEAVDRCTKPVLLIAHSLGTSLIMRWAHAAKTEVAGAFLVAPTDRDRRDNDPARGFSPMLLQPLPFPSMVLASRDDELVAFERAQVFATSWGSHLIDVGSLGHVGSAANLGLWPQGLVWFGQFIASLPPHSRGERVTSPVP